MDVMPKHPESSDPSPESPEPKRPFPDPAGAAPSAPHESPPPEPRLRRSWPFPAHDPASLAEPPPASLRTTLRRAAFGMVAGAVLVTGAVVAVPDEKKESVPALPGPASRALSATSAGAPVSLPDLTALIGDRQAWVGTHPSDARSWAVLGAAYVEKGRRSADAAAYGRAEQALKRSLDVLPGDQGNAAAWVGLAALANARHDFVAAKKWGETVRTRQPSQWSAYPVLIDAYDGLGEYTAATKAVEKFAALRAGVPSLLRTARMYRDKGWREDALASAQDATDRARTPAEKAECLTLLGELAWERGEPKEAVAQYGAALRTDRSHHPALAGRARALAALGRTDEAQRDYLAALARHPSPAYMLELAELYESLGLDGDARSQYSRFRNAVMGAERQGVDERLLRGRYEADHGDASTAVEVLSGQWERGHHSAAVADALGWALHRSGDSGAALEYARRASETGGRNALYAYHLGAIERALGDSGPARRHLEEAVRTNPAFSPLAGPRAQEALDALGQPLAGGPQDTRPAPAPQPTAPAQGQGQGQQTVPAPGGQQPAVPAPQPTTPQDGGGQNSGGQGGGRNSGQATAANAQAAGRPAAVRAPLASPAVR